MSSSSRKSDPGQLGPGLREDPVDPASAPVLDEVHMSQLKELVTDSKRSLFAELAEIFKRESVGRFQKLEVAVQEKDAASIAKLSHSLIGSAASLGARQLQIALRALEKQAASADWAKIQSGHSEVARFRRVLLDELDRHEGGEQ